MRLAWTSSRFGASAAGRGEGTQIRTWSLSDGPSWWIRRPPRNAYVQSLLSNDDVWVSKTVTSLKEVSTCGVTEAAPTKLVPTITTPKKPLYKSRISIAKEKLIAGESYELCLTALSHISLPQIQSDSSSSWRLFRDLRKANPAPHFAYLRPHPTTLVSSPPDRFISFARRPTQSINFGPSKGQPGGPGITRAVAEDALIGCPKRDVREIVR